MRKAAGSVSGLFLFRHWRIRGRNGQTRDAQQHRAQGPAGDHAAGAEFGDNVGTVMAVPDRIRRAAARVPDLLPQGREQRRIPVRRAAGLRQGRKPVSRETAAGTRPTCPASIARGPFLIGFQERQEGGEIRREPVIHVDMDHPRVSKTEGEPVFLPQGGNSRYLDHIAAVLDGIRDGLEVSKAMFAAFTARISSSR